MIPQQEREYNDKDIGNSDYKAALESHVNWVLEEMDVLPSEIVSNGDLSDYLDERREAGDYRDETGSGQDTLPEPNEITKDRIIGK